MKIHIRNYLFLPLALIFCSLSWLFINYELFPESRTLLPFACTFLFIIIFLFSGISIISIPIIYLFKKKPHAIIKQIAFLGITTLCFWVLLGTLLPHNLPTGSDLLKFDSIAWTIDESKPLPKNLVTTRQKMLKDVVENVLPSKSKDEIVRLLGTQTQTSNFKGMYDLIYVLGPQRDSLMGMDYEWLLIHLKNEKFEKYSIVTD